MSRQTRINFLLTIATFFLSSGSVFAGPFGLFKRCQPGTRNCAVPAPCSQDCEPKDQSLWIATAAGTTSMGYSCYGTSSPKPTAAEAVVEAEAKALENGCVSIDHIHTQQVYGSLQFVCSHPIGAVVAGSVQSDARATLWVADAYGLKNGYSCNASSDPHPLVGDAVAEAESRAANDNCVVSHIHTRQVQGFAGAVSRGSSCPDRTVCYKATFRIWCCGGGVFEATVKCNDLGLVKRLARAIACEKARASCCRIRCSRMYCCRLPVGELCCPR